MDERETRIQQSLEAGLESLAEQRTTNAELSGKQDDSREALQQARAELATLQSVQNAAYGGSNEQVVSWLKQTGLEDKSRLAQNLQVDAGWEQAVESILGHFLEAVCVADESDYARKLNDLIKGRICLVNEAVSAIHDTNDERLLLNKVNSPSNLSGLLNQVYVADDLESALVMRSTLPVGATVVTAEGICLGHGWVRATVETGKEGILQREQRMQSLAISIETLEGEYAAFSISQSTVPIPAAIWLFGSAILGLFGFLRRSISK